MAGEVVSLASDDALLKDQMGTSSGSRRRKGKKRKRSTKRIPKAVDTKPSLISRAMGQR